MLDMVKGMFNKEDEEVNSKEVAKERLRLVLVHDRMDRLGVSREVLSSMKGELIEVISKHLEIDEQGLEIKFDRQDDSVALEANIPIKGNQKKDNE